MPAETRKLSDITVGTRARRDLGDVGALAQSIAAIGLLHPVVVTPDNRLVAGQRRLEAHRLLGLADVPVTVVDLAELVRGEYAENTQRKDFTPSEAVAIGRALEPAVATPEGRPAEETRESCPRLPKGRTRDKVAAAVGLSGRTYEKAKAVVAAAEAEPDLAADLQEQMDESGKVDAAYKELQKRKKARAKAAVPDDLPAATDRYRVLCGDGLARDGVDAAIVPGSVDAIITDPPYGEEVVDLCTRLAQAATRWLKPGGSLVVLVGQYRLPEVLWHMSQHLPYRWTLAYLTPGGQAVQIWQRKVNTFWKPVLWFTNGTCGGDWIGDVLKSAVNDNDKRFHEWGQSESGMADIVERFTTPGQVVLDPFMGAGTTGVVALRMHRLFVGIDCDAAHVETAKRRLAEAVDTPHAEVPA